MTPDRLTLAACFRAPGGPVVLRNREGRANRDDLAEAASLAAFRSERRMEGQVDVRYTDRKHVQPQGSGQGRVRVTHAAVIRASPRDPAGRLGARS
jgi:predicted ribosome quality control (RQC) complex YloA/Tae2 family protein